jgi:Tfp pilus assembly protein PilF
VTAGANEIAAPRPGRFAVLSTLVFAGTLVAYWPASQYDFINYDDQAYFVLNPNFRGLGWDNLRWCFSTTYLGHYQPLNWLSYAINYSLWGLDAGRMHLTQITLHGIAAILLAAVVRSLLLRSEARANARSIDIAAAMGGLFFGLHPLRVESVAWLSARSDVLAGIFCLASILSYLQAVKLRSTLRMALPLLFFMCAILSKEMAVTLPAVLLLLDYYPLRRYRLTGESLRSSGFRAALQEKVPFFILSAAVIIWAIPAAGHGVASIDEHPIARRLAQLPVSLAFYPWKTIAPFALSPLYEFPSAFGGTHPLVIRSICITAVMIAACILLRRKWPTLITSIVCYAILILPVSGLTQRGPQMVADRYSYLACMPFAVLAGALLATISLPWRRIALIMCGVVLAALSIQTRSQLAIWRDSIALWQRALQIDPNNAGAHANLAQALQDAGRFEDAIKEHRTALAINATYLGVHRRLAAALMRVGRRPEAIEAYLKDAKENPADADSRYYLAIACEQENDAARAAHWYQEAIRLDEKHVDARFRLGRMFVIDRQYPSAEPLLRSALELNPEQLDALGLLAEVCARTNRTAEAVALIDRAIRRSETLGDARAVESLRAIRSEYKPMNSSN